MSWSDELVFTVADVCDRVEHRTDRPDAKIACASKRLGTAVGAISAATAQNVPVGFADLLTLATLQRMSFEDPWAARTFDAEDLALLRDTFTAAEQTLWGRAGQIITPGQQKELHELILAWRRDHPEQVSLYFVRLQDFAAARKVSFREPSSARPTSIFGLLWIDPTANLAPAARQLKETRLLAERITYWGQRLPLILGWQTEMTSARLLNSGPAKELLQNTSQVAEAAGDFSRTAERMATSYDRMLDKLPEERSAAIEQVERTVAARTQEAIEQADRTMAVRTQAAIEQSAAAFAAERKATIDQLTDAYSKGMLTTVDRLSREFDVQSERSLDRMAKTLAEERKQISAQLSAHLADVDAASQRLIDRLAARLLLVVVIGTLAIACIVFAYRRIEARFASNGPPASRRDDGPSPPASPPPGRPTTR